MDSALTAVNSSTPTSASSTSNIQKAQDTSAAKNLRNTYYLDMDHGEKNNQNNRNGSAGGQPQQQHQQPQVPPASAVMPPPHQQPRADSLSMYTNFAAPRLSTDSSISSFLNINDNQQQGQQPNQQGQQTGQQQAPDISSYGRGYSIINNLFTGGPSTGHPGSTSNVSASGPEAGQFTTARRQSEQLEPFMPRFKTPIFSSGRSGSTIHAPAPPPPAGSSGRGDSISMGGSGNGGGNGGGGGGKRNSIFFGSADAPELEFFNPSKRDSMMMKPPSVAPLKSASNSAAGTAGAANASGQGNDDLDALFNSSYSRKNSIKFAPEDFDFQFKRRDSSVRATLDNNNYIPGPPPGQKNKDEAISPIDKPDDDVEARIHKHLSPLVHTKEGGNQNQRQSPLQDLRSTGKGKKRTASTTRNDLKKKKKQVAKKEQTVDTNSSTPTPPSSVNGGTVVTTSPSQQIKPESVKNLIHLLEPKDATVTEDGRPLLGATKVDQLMLVIQARKKGVTDKVPRSADGSLMIEDTPSLIPPPSELVGGVEKPKARGVKQHECPYCHKCFTQSTHLEVHVRSHIGYKPFQCEYCGKRFTQGGNLRTHTRLHTGEKPYSCEKCGKRFSRKGNLAAHMLTHENLKPYHCKLDGCSKSFTQLGNLKAHQNRFHLQTLNQLTQRLAEMDPNENIDPDERALLDYFANLYKNSNRGIRGRGKGNTNVRPSSTPVTPKSTDKPDDDHTSAVAAKALGAIKPADSVPELNYNLYTNASPAENGSSGAQDTTTNEFTFSLGDHDKNQEEVGGSISGSHAPAFGSRRNNPGDTSSGRSEVQFKNISYQS